MFKEIKTTQMAAYFLTKAPAFSMPHLKLMKLLYLSDRESIAKYDAPMTGDVYFSLPHGPILSRTKNLIDGDYHSGSFWPKVIADKRDYEVAVTTEEQNIDFDELSQADIEILETIWAQFGHMDKWEIREYTHKHCSEWKDPGDSHIPITLSSIAKAVGSPPDTLAENQSIENALSRLST